MNPTIKVIIPAFNEQNSIAHVVNDIPNIVNEVIVINNNSTDKTAENAKLAGATVLNENNPGYGYACLKGMDYIAQHTQQPDIVVFLDGDYSDYPEQLTEIVAPIINNNIDFVIFRFNRFVIEVDNTITVFFIIRKLTFIRKQSFIVIKTPPFCLFSYIIMHYDIGKKTKWWSFYNNKGLLSNKCQFSDNKKNGYRIIYLNNKPIKAEYYKINIIINNWSYNFCELLGVVRVIAI